jgi:hypothetical protein
MAAKKSGKTQITNTSEQAYALPDGTHIGVGESVVVTNEVWEAAEENETVQAWIESGALEVEAADTSAEDAAAAEEEERKRKEKEKADKEKGAQAAAAKAKTSDR